MLKQIVKGSQSSQDNKQINNGWVRASEAPEWNWDIKAIGPPEHIEIVWIFSGPEKILPCDWVLQWWRVVWQNCGRVVL